MKDEDDVLLGAAENVADGAPVDWDSAARTHQALSRPLGRLRMLERVATAHRAMRTEPGSPAQPAPAAAPAGAPEPLPACWGPLRILGRIGSGGYGDVYRAHDPALGRDVALKLCRPGAATTGPGAADAAGASRFLDEARRLARLRHPNVLIVHGADRHDGRAGLWADLVQGRTLEECLAEQGPFSADEAALVGIDLCRALAAVHAAGLIHRDVKTTNVMRERGGRIVLMDFGAVAERLPSGPVAGDEPITGTPLFMAPELFTGGRPDVASDLYALGVVLYRLVTGRYPVEADNLEALRRRHETGESVPLHDVRPDLPAAFVQAVSKALSARPAERPATAGEFEQSLAGTLGAVPAGVLPAGSTVRPRRPIGLGMAAAIAVFVGATAGALYSFLQPPAFQVDASFFRAGEASEERLVDGGRLNPDDRLFLEVRGSRAMYVYVFDEDEAGHAFVLFPLPGLDQGNPLAAEQPHRLPGSASGEARFWGMSSDGGMETVSIVASLEPLADLEEEMRRLPRAGSATPAAITPPALEHSLRGLGRLVAPEPAGAPPPERPLFGVLGRVANRAAGSGGVWIRQIQLRSGTP